jgi:hypothetical protein
MAAPQEETTTNVGNDTKTTAESNARSAKIDRNAPAGSKNSLGAESVRNGRPATDDSVVEAMDEEGPGFTPPSATKTGHPERSIKPSVKP